MYKNENRIIIYNCVYTPVHSDGKRGDNMLNVLRLKCEDRIRNISVTKNNPKFSYQVMANKKNVMIEESQIQLCKNSGFCQDVVYDSGRVAADPSGFIEYKGEGLRSFEKYFFRIRVWDQEGEDSGWSKNSYFETAFVEDGKITAPFISTTDDKEKEGETPCVIMRRAFVLEDDIKSAKICISAKGLYELRLNGEKVGEDFFTPGFTDYHKKLQYQTYDVTDALQRGGNALAVIVGDGWYKGYINWDCVRNFYGDKREVVLELHVKLRNGKTVVLKSDEEFKWAYSPIESSEIYHGEKYDATKEMDHFDEYHFDDSEFLPVKVCKYDNSILVGQQGEPVKAVKTLKPVAIIHTPSNETLIDMGQVMVGNVRVKVRGQKGDRVLLKHGEMLDKDGNFYCENIAPSRQETEYILRGGREETYLPRFTYQCFRYVKVLEFPGEPTLDQFEGVVLSSFGEEAGSFACSDPMLTKLHQNITWSQRGNFMDIPIAGPQRTERLGWTGDTQIFIKTACFNMNAKAFFEKWLDDLRLDQFPNGAVPWVVPNVLRKPEYECLDFFDTDEEYPTSAAWGDAALIVPWVLYLNYADPEILAHQYESMKRYVEYMRDSGTDPYVFDYGFHYGDWFALDAKEGSFVGATPKPYIATAFYAYSTSILAKAAAVLGKREDSLYYEQLFKTIRRRFQEIYLKKGHLTVKTQTACVLALHFDLLPKKARAGIAADLYDLLEERDFHISTGFVGTGFICDVLSENGYQDIAYKLLLNKDCPSWLYQITRGATTIWEHWDGYKPDGSFWEPWMNSFNHYAYGCIGDFMYRNLGGIRLDEKEPGYRHFYIEPKPGAGITWAEASHMTTHGKISVRWELEEEMIHFKLNIPVNTHATVHLPVKEEMRKMLHGEITMHLGSGEYEFSYTY